MSIISEPAKSTGKKGRPPRARRAFNTFLYELTLKKLMGNCGVTLLERQAPAF
jgi:hypothetical protein